MKMSDEVYRELYIAMSRAVTHGTELGTHDVGVFEVDGIYRTSPTAYVKCCAIGCYLIGKSSTGDWLKDAAEGLKIDINAVALISRGFDLGPSDVTKDEYFMVGAKLKASFGIL